MRTLAAWTFSRRGHRREQVVSLGATRGGILRAKRRSPTGCDSSHGAGFAAAGGNRGVSDCARGGRFGVEFAECLSELGPAAAGVNVVQVVVARKGSVRGWRAEYDAFDKRGRRGVFAGTGAKVGFSGNRG